MLFTQHAAPRFAQPHTRLDINRADKLHVSAQPDDHVVVVHKGQLARDARQFASFMKRKKGRPGLTQSESELLHSAMDRHYDWAVAVCPVAAGPEINTVEAGISAWLESVRTAFPGWDVLISRHLTDSEYAATGALARLAESRAKTVPAPISRWGMAGGTLLMPRLTSPRKRSSRTFARNKNLRFSWAMRTRHVIPDVQQAVFPQPASVLLWLLFVGHLECLKSHREISWRCSDSRSLGEFLGLGPADPVRNDSCVSKTQNRLPKEVFDRVFRFHLSLAARKGLLCRDAIGMEPTTIRANASMRPLIRKDSGKGWKDYTKKFTKTKGLDDPTDDDLRQFDRNRLGKTASTNDWDDPHDPDTTIKRMKDGTTRLAYEAEQAVDLDTDIIVSPTVHTPNTTTIIDMAIDAAANTEERGAGSAVAGKGYRSTKAVALGTEFGMRTYISEHHSPQKRSRSDKHPNDKPAFYATRRRTKRERGRQLGRLHSLLTARLFTHACDTGGVRQSWLRGLASVAKPHLTAVASRNLSTILRALCGIGERRSLQGLRELLQTAWYHLGRLLWAFNQLIMPLAGYQGKFPIAANA